MGNNTPRTRRPRLRTTPLTWPAALAIVALVAACGDDDTTPSATDTSASGTPGVTASGLPTGPGTSDSPGSGPSSETPSSETPSSETPSSETPSSETPSSETPSSETPPSETPTSQAYTPPEPRQTLAAVVDAVHLSTPGDRHEVEAQVRTGFDPPIAVATFTLQSDDETVVTIEDRELVAVAAGTATVRLQATVGDETLESVIDVVVGPDILVLSGIATGLHAVTASTGTASGIALDGVDLSSDVTIPGGLRIVDGRGYAIFSGDSFGGTADSSLLIFDPLTLEPIALLADIAPPGAYDVAVRSPSELWLIGSGNTVHAIDVDAGTAAALDVFDDPRIDVPISLGAGSAAVAWGPWVIIGNSTLDATFSPHVPAALFFLDITGEEPALFDGFPTAPAEGSDTSGSPDAAPYLAVPPACVNINALELGGRHLLVGCTGNRGDTPAAVTALDLRTLEFTHTVSFAAGSMNGMAWDPFSGIVVVSSGDGEATLGVIDIWGEEVLRDLGDGALQLGANGFTGWNAATVARGADGFLAATFGSNEVFSFSIDQVLDADMTSIDAVATLASGAGAQFVAPRAAHRPARALDAASVRILHPSPGDGFANPRNVFGPPAGGGAFAPNFSSEKLMTVPAGEAVTFLLEGVTITDGPGDDFVVFENVLFLGGDPMIRAVDPARIELSADGETWVPYPIEEDEAYAMGAYAGGFATDVRRFVEGFLGIEPVWANPATNAIALGHPSAGGDRFDLARVGLPEVRAIRIIADHASGNTPDIDSIALIHWRHD